MRMFACGLSALVAVACCRTGNGGDAPSEVYARQEFSRYVTRMTGRDYDGPLEIVLDGKLGKEEFVVSKRDGKLSIRGGVRGVLYGVYDVLEKFGGVRWYSSWCEKVPKAERLAVPEGTDYSEKPAFWTRLPYWIDVLKHPDFAARLRVNGHLSEPLQPWHGGPAYQLDKKFGFSHTFNFLVPPAEFKDTHPEYFSEIGGKRVTERTQLCLTNPDVFDLVVRRIREAIAENPEADMYALAHNDYKNWCECAKCKAINDAEGNPGMTEFLFVNKVVSEIAKDHPNIIFKLSAYVYTRKPPKDFKFHPNVMVDLCPIEADLVFPLPESKFKDSVAFCRDMEGWSKVRGDNFLVWDYNTSFLDLLQILPNAYTPQGNAKYYRSMGVNMVFNQGDYTGYHADFAELKAYLQAKWAWNPDLPAEPLVADFFEGYYGPAAPFIREFFDDVYARQRAYCADGTHFMTCYTPAVKELAVDSEFFRKSAVLWARAKAAVRGDPTFEYNVKTSALSFLYTALCLNGKRYFLTAHPEKFGPETDAYRLAKTCVETMDEARRKRGGMVRLVEDIGRHKLRYAGLENIVKSGPVDKSVKTSLVIEAKDFGRSRDFALTNGVARFNRGRYDWVTALNPCNLAYDKGVRYRLRVHAKVERSADRPDGIAFKGGYHDPGNKVSFEKSFKASEASTEWKWYDIGETEFGPRGLFWISSGTFDKKKFKENPCIDAVLIDKVEVSVSGTAENGRDVVIYGATSAGLAAAVQARRMGLDVEIVSPTREIGGLTTGGLGATDIGNKSAIGGIAREFYRAVKEHYADPSSWRNQTAAEYAAIRREQHRLPDPDAMWTFEPSAATKILEGWVRRDGIPIRRGARLDRGKGGVTTEAGRIVAIRDEDGRTYRAKVFIDATYEGDLMAAAGVSYAVGREPNAKYGEKDNGIERGLSVNHQFRPGVDPYVVKGDPKSGLLPFVEQDVALPDGAGDGRVQAYCFRMCLTDDPSNRIPFAKPEGYDPLDYELLLRNFEAGEASPEADPQGRLMWINTPMPNRKTDTNNRTGFSTDFIGGADRWPEASYAEREEIAKRHLRYQQGLMWTLANDPRVPEHVRTEVSRWGTCRDEFPGERGNGWQNQLYVREARRMVGEYVMTEHDCRRERTATRSIGLGAYGMDSHHVRRYVGADGFVRNEGNIEDWEHGGKPYPIDYGAIVPKRSECRNLLVPVCVSASHMAFGSIRMEPVFFVLGQSAATAAALAVRNGSDVQDVGYAALRERLLADGQRLDPPRAE